MKIVHAIPTNEKESSRKSSRDISSSVYSSAKIVTLITFSFYLEKVFHDLAKTNSHETKNDKSGTFLHFLQVSFLPFVVIAQAKNICFTNLCFLE